MAGRRIVHVTPGRAIAPDPVDPLWLHSPGG